MIGATEHSVVHARVVAIGDSAVGKTSLVSRLMEERFDPGEAPTIGANWQLYVHEFNCERVELQIWDTAGQEKFRSLGPLYYRSASGAIAVFDVTRRSSFESLDSWISAFTEVAGLQVTVVIAANKSDMDHERQVSQKESQDWARQRGCMLYETSAKTGENVAQLFRALAEEVLNRMTPQENKKTDFMGSGGGGSQKCC
jgi:small GTP-binding protein